MTHSRYILGIRKYLTFIKMYNRKYKFPLRFLLYLSKLAKYEKLVQLDDKIIFSSFVPPIPSKAFDRFMCGIGRGVPVAVYISVTTQCKYSCWHCSDSYRHNAQLSKEELIDVINQFDELGTAIFGFTGGEPLLRSDVPEIIKQISENSSTILFTSGDGFTDEKAKELKNAGLFFVVVSLDHFDEKEHNLLRGNEHAFEHAINAINLAISHGFYTVVSTVVRKDFPIWQFLEYTKKLGVDEVRILEPLPCGKLITEEHQLNENDRKMLIDVHKIANRTSIYPRVSVFSYIESEKVLGCAGGYNHIFVDAGGNICPCDFTPLSFGNVKNEKVKVIYERMKTEFQTPKNCCFMSDNYKTIGKNFKGELPFQRDESIKILNECKKSETPKFYRLLK